MDQLVAKVASSTQSQQEARKMKGEKANTSISFVMPYYDHQCTINIVSRELFVKSGELKLPLVSDTQQCFPEFPLEKVPVSCVGTVQAPPFLEMELDVKTNVSWGNMDVGAHCYQAQCYSGLCSGLLIRPTRMTRMGQSMDDATSWYSLLTVL